MNIYITTHDTLTVIDKASDYIRNVAYDMNEGGHPQVRGLLKSLDNARSRLRKLTGKELVMLKNAIKGLEEEIVAGMDEADDDGSFDYWFEQLETLVTFADLFGLDESHLLDHFTDEAIAESRKRKR